MDRDTLETGYLTWTPRGVDIDPSDPGEPALLEVLLRSPSPPYCAPDIHAPLAGPEYVYAVVIANVIAVPNLEVPLSDVCPPPFAPFGVPLFLLNTARPEVLPEGGRTSCTRIYAFE